MTAAPVAATQGERDHRAEADREARRGRIARWLTLGAGFGLTFLIYAPVLWLAVLSVSAEPLSGFAGPFTLKWYASLFAEPGWLDPLLHTLGLASVVSCLCVVSALLVGRGLPRLGRPAFWLMAGFLLPLAIPGVVLGIDVFIGYKLVLGLRMGAWSLVLVHFIWAFPFALLAMLVVTSRFDGQLLDAAADLGAGSWRRFWDIERPLLMPGIVSAGLFGFLLSLTELPRSIFVYGRLQTLPLFTWAEASSRSSQVPLIYCLNSLISAVSLGLSILAIRLLSRRRPS